MEDFRKVIKKNAIQALITHEVTLLARTRERKGNKAQRYFNSSSTRDNFAKVMVHAFLTERYYSIAEICSLLAISRVATISMVDDCVAEGWVTTIPGKRNSRLCQANDSLVSMAESWFDMHKKSIRDTGCDSHFRLLENLDQAIADQNRLQNRISV